MLASFVILRTMAPKKYWCVVDMEASSPAATWNLHTTTKYFAPTYNEVVNLTSLM
jgi:hypothetical protein